MGNENGFTLIEVLIAITLLAVGLLGVAGMQTNAMMGNTFSRTGTEAVVLAEEMVDRIRTNAGTNPVVYNGIDTSGSCDLTPTRLKNDCDAWKSRISDSNLKNAVGTVSVAKDQPLENTATVEVKLTWGGAIGGRSVVFTTILETWGT